VSRLPRISGQECIAALGRLGFYVRRRESSHIILRRDDPYAQVVVPDHRELDRGTLRAIVRQAGTSVEELIRVLAER
jgi:predicted RNA binding protein YcfA (HicA-like mRNA interferase family)